VHNEQEHEQHCCDDKDGKEAFHLLLFVDRTNEGTRQTKFKRRSQPFFGTLVIFLEASAYFAARRSRQRVGTMSAIIAFSWKITAGYQDKQ
jgi:hypothetical protein